MPSSVMWHSVGLVRTDVSEQCVAYIFRVARVLELGTLAVTSRLNNCAKKR
jgi:hypothetical protein